MSEHIKMTPQEAKAKVAALRQIVLDTYEKEIRNHPYFRDLRSGTLEKGCLQFWVKNWHAFAVEVNTGMATVYHQFVGFFKRHPELEDMVAQKIGEEVTTPGLARVLLKLGAALGVSREEMIECELIPEARGLVDFFVRSWIDVPLAECYAIHLEEEIFGHIAQDYRAGLPKYGLSKEDMEYFKIHEEADLSEEHGGTNQRILEAALMDGYGQERAGWPLEYCSRVSVQMMTTFYDGIYRRNKGIKL